MKEIKLIIHLLLYNIKSYIIYINIFYNKHYYTSVYNKYI